jgi:hypothetical protein
VREELVEVSETVRRVGRVEVLFLVLQMETA